MTPQHFSDLTRRVSEFLGTSVGISENLIQTIIVVVVMLLVRYLFLLIVYWQTSDPERKYNYKRYSAQVVFVIAVFVVGRIWFEGFQSLATFLGLLSVGLALALRELLTDLAGWLFIIVRKPFELGDRIEVAGVKGDVIDKRLFTFSVIEIGNRVGAEQSTGRVIHIPNSKVFTEYLANYTSGFRFIWHEVPVPVTFESDHKKAAEIVQSIVDTHCSLFVEQAEKEMKQAKESFMLKFSVLTPAVFTSVKENGVVLTARFLCPVRRTRRMEQLLWLDILEAFKKEPSIRFAYNTTRLVKFGDDDADKDYSGGS